ncbi:MAG: glycosyltransferase family 2 protein [Lachnospiraceae bacterium]|nr:glycosyltransferase family 2 protein [Lachnospiraceae bacterium]
MTKVSICVPAYNNLSCVQRLLNSIAGQDYTDFEIIITDDSTNGELENYIHTIQSETAHVLPIGMQAKIRYRHNAKPLGHIFNWNEALSLAEGEYIKIMFSDDWFSRADSLGKMVGMLEDNKDASLAFCGTGQVLLGGDKEELLRERAASEAFIGQLRKDYRYLFLGNEIGAPSATIYRNDQFRFDEKSNWASDMFLYFDILEKNPVFAWTDEALINIGEHEEQYTNMFRERDERKYEDYRYMYEKYELSANDDCKEYFLREFLLPYGKGSKAAAACGIEPGVYRKERIKYLRDAKIKAYWNAGIRKIGKILK